jgi:hypothetical protein
VLRVFLQGLTSMTTNLNQQKYDPKVSTIEETRDLTKMTMDELHGTLMAYEMRTSIESDQTNNESAFKAIKKTKDKDNDLDEEI